MVLTRQQSQPSTNFFEPISTISSLTGDVESFTEANFASVKSLSSTVSRVPFCAATSATWSQNLVAWW